MEEIKKCMRQTKTILKQDVGVMDTNGLVIASTDPENEGKTDSSARAVMMSDDIFSGTADRTYMKVAIGEQFRYIIYIQSDEPAARTYLELLAEWIKTAVKERGTDAEKELFTKNVLLENELQGEIPIKAREYKINCSEARLVMVVRSSREDGAEVLEILHVYLQWMRLRLSLCLMPRRLWDQRMREISSSRTARLPYLTALIMKDLRYISA